MKYTVQIDINAPRDTVTRLFDDPKNMEHWMKGLKSFEPLSGTPGQPGAKSRLKFKTGNRELEMIETVTVRNLPNEFSGTYEAGGVVSSTKNFFKDLGNGTTRIISENEFQLTGFMKILGWLMPGMFKKQSLQYLQDLKTFVESQK